MSGRNAKFLLSVLLVATVGPSRAEAPPSLAEVLASGKVCHVTLSAPYSNGCAVGDLARSTAYAVSYSKGVWTVTGAICDSTNRQTHSDRGPDPKSGEMSLWNAPFTFDAKGKVKSKQDSNVSGTLSCK